MEQGHIVKIINAALKARWSHKETRSGKSIKCMPSWHQEIKDLVILYEEKGWIVEKRVAITSRGRQLFLNFKHPTW